MSRQQAAPARPLYDRVEEIRIRNGWSKVQLARRLGLNRGTIENWKTQPRPPQPSTVHDVATRLGVDQDWALRLAGIVPMKEPTARERLADYLQRRADQLGIEWGDLVQGVPDITRQFGVEHLSRRDMRVLEDRLRWERGGIEAIVEGGEPTPLVDRHVELRDSARAEDDLADRPPTRQELEEITAEIRRLRKELDDVKAQQAERSTSQVRRDLDMG